MIANRRIIFVHGRGEKPRERIEHALVTAAIENGVRRAIELRTAASLPVPPVEITSNTVRVAYFAQIFTEKYEPDFEYTGALQKLRLRPTALFTREAYLAERNVLRFHSWRDEAYEKLGGVATNAVGARRVVAQFAPEMLRYSDEPDIRASLHRLLAQACGFIGRSKVAPQLLLIGHSLGSVFLYDALRASVLDHAVAKLVTIGSPLGDPSMRQLVQALPGGNEASAPVESWVNIAAEDDHVSHATQLAALYRCTNGNTIEDIACENFFVHPKHGSNPHKSYGYLDHPVMGNIVLDFLTK